MQNPFAKPAAQHPVSGPLSRPASRRKLTGLVLGAGALLLPAAPLWADVGAVMAVVPQAETGASGQMRRVDLGDRVIMGQAFRTDAGGMAQVTFVDGSSFTIGPNSELVIDRFIYDPDKGTAELAATATRGVFRFIGGAASKGEGGAMITTPVGTAGIRGAQAMFGLTPDNGLQFIMDYGRDTRFTPPAGNAPPQLIQPGMMLQVGPDGSITTTTNSAAIDAAAAALVGAMQPPPPPAGSAPSPSALGFGLDSARSAAQTGEAQGGSGTSFGAGLPPPALASNSGDSTAQPSFGQDQSARGLELGFSNEIGRLIEAERNPVRPPPPIILPPQPVRSIDGMRTGFATATRIFGDSSLGEITLSFDIDAPSMGAELNFGSVSGGFADDVGEYISDSSFGTRPGSATEVLLRSADPTALCDCDYLQWGMWQGNISLTNPTLLGMQGYWVAGDMSDLSGMPPPAEATYTGTAIGVVRQFGDPILARSPFSATADFANGEITTRMSNFNGEDLTGMAEISPSGQIEFGQMRSANNAFGRFEGGFVADGPDLVGGVIGSFSVTSPGGSGSFGWSGTGIFAGDRTP